MFVYEYFDLTIESEIELPDLPPGEGPPDVRIRLREVVRSKEPASLAWEQSRLKGVGAISVSGGTDIVLDLLPEANLELVRLILVGRFTARILRQRGWFPLHASAVKIGDRAVLFLAASGTGKSTLAAAMHARGHQVLSDDVAPVRIISGKWVLCTGTSRLRLLEDSALLYGKLDPNSRFQFDKHAFSLGRPLAQPYVRVSRIYAVEDGEDAYIGPVTPLDAVRLLGRECFVRLRSAGPDLLAVHLRDCAQLAERQLVRQLVRPRRMETLDQVCALVEDDALSSSDPTGQPRRHVMPAIS